MTKINVSTGAVKEFECDEMTVTFNVAVKEADSGKAAAVGKEQVEKLLAALEEKASIKPENMAFEDENVVESRFEDDSKKRFTFEKSFSFSAKADMAVVGALTDIVKGLKYAEYDVDFFLSENDAKKDEVLAAATENSRRKAEIIAKSLGLKITGIGKVNFGGRGSYSVQELQQEQIMTVGVKPKGRAALVALPKRRIESSVDITWLAE